MTKRATMRTLALATLLFITGSTSGCFVWYEHRIEESNLRVYSNEDPQDLAEAAAYLERAIYAFQELFPKHADHIPAANVVLEVAELNRRGIYLAEPEQEGYYLPLLNLIHLSPQILRSTSDVAGNDDLRTVILHELCHHFLISSFPESDSRYWINEGLACVIENSRIDNGGHLVMPFYNPALHLHARHALFYELGTKKFFDEVQQLLDLSWFGFHDSKSKTRHYALSYVAMHHLLAQFGGTIEDRVAKILSLSDDEVLSRLRLLPLDINELPVTKLARLARRPEYRAWALEQWVALSPRQIARPRLQHPRHPTLQMVDWLIDELHDSHSETRQHGLELATRLAASIGPSPTQRYLEQEILGALSGGTTAERERVLTNLDYAGSRRQFLRPLVAALESATDDIRIAAVHALARFGNTKATVIRPRFWQGASNDERRREIDEWQEWLDQRGL